MTIFNALVAYGPPPVPDGWTGVVNNVESYSDGNRTTTVAGGGSTSSRSYATVTLPAVGKFGFELLLGGSYAIRNPDVVRDYMNCGVLLQDISETYYFTIIATNNNPSGNLGSGSIITVLLDMTANTYETRKNNVFYDSGTIDIAGGIGVELESGSAGGESLSVTTRFKASQLSYSLPSGYSALLPG